MLAFPVFVIEEAVELVTGSRRRARRKKEQETWDRNILVLHKSLDVLAMVAMSLALRVVSRR